MSDGPTETERRVNPAHSQLMSAPLVTVRSDGSFVGVLLPTWVTDMVSDVPLACGYFTVVNSGPSTTWTVSPRPLIRSMCAPAGWPPPSRGLLVAQRVVHRRGAHGSPVGAAVGLEGVEPVQLELSGGGDGEPGGFGPVGDLDADVARVGGDRLDLLGHRVRRKRPAQVSVASADGAGCRRRRSWWPPSAG